MKRNSEENEYVDFCHVSTKGNDILRNEIVEALISEANNSEIH